MDGGPVLVDVEPPVALVAAPLVAATKAIRFADLPFNGGRHEHAAESSFSSPRGRVSRSFNGGRHEHAAEWSSMSMRAFTYMSLQ